MGADFETAKAVILALGLRSDWTSQQACRLIRAAYQEQGCPDAVAGEPGMTDAARLTAIALSVRSDVASRDAVTLLWKAYPASRPSDGPDGEPEVEGVPGPR